MNTSYNFTLDDQVNPVYCVQCRAHIPMLNSMQHNGVCPDCLQANHLAAVGRVAAPPPISHTAFPEQGNQPRLRFPSSLIFSILLTFILITVSLTAYHLLVVAPLEAELMNARDDSSLVRADLLNSRRQLKDARRQVEQSRMDAEHGRQSLGADQDHLNRLIGRTRQNAAAANYFNSYR